MSNILNVFKNIIHPKKDFLFSCHIKNDKHLEAIYEKIFMELSNWLIKSKNLKVKKCKFIKNEGIIEVFTKYAYEIKVSFENHEVDVFINGNNIGCSKIYGATIDKENLTVSDVRIDLASFKMKLSKMLK
jgi:hypothetical protein